MNQYGTLHQQGEFEVENHSVPQLGPHTQSDPPSASWQYMGPWSASPASFSHTRGQPLEDCPLIPRRPNVCGVRNHQLHILDNDKGKAPLVNEVELPPVVCGLPARPKSDSDSSLSSASEADIYFDGHGHVMPSPLRHSPSALLDSTQILFGPSGVLSAGPFFIDPIRRDPPNWVGDPVLTSAHLIRVGAHPALLKQDPATGRSTHRILLFCFRVWIHRFVLLQAPLTVRRFHRSLSPPLHRLMVVHLSALCRLLFRRILVRIRGMCKTLVLPILRSLWILVTLHRRLLR